MMVFFINYKDGEIVKLLCIILPQMSGYIKYFENGGKNMSFIVKDDTLLLCYSGQVKNSHFTDFEKFLSKSKDGSFAESGQEKNHNLASKLPWEKLDT